ncbi:MAG: hypothetical protein KDC54_02810 [Lewinella sp.]|nr:hypothetical protein [Lewinella sp.]
MLNLLRKVRRRLVVEKNVRQYLLYAIGEIVLIVVGILLALGISNWQEDLRKEKKEQFYLDGLRTEFELSRAKLQTLIEVNQLNYQEAEQLAGWIKANARPTELELSRKLTNAFSYELDYNPNSALLEELINAGGLQDLRNVELRRHLTGWESYIQSVRRQEAGLRQLRERLIDHLRGEAYSIRTILEEAGDLRAGVDEPAVEPLVSNLPILKSRAFENDLLLFLVTARNTETEHYRPLLAEIDTILGLIGQGQE